MSIVVPILLLGCGEDPIKQEPPKKVGGHIMVHVPSQSVQIGRSGVVPYDEQPEHRVFVEGFYMTRTEVTNQQFTQFLNEAKLTTAQSVLLFGFKGNSMRPTQVVKTGTRYRPALGRGKFPVSTVTYDGAKAYCSWIGTRLPTEVEWVAAIRGGTDTLYPWGEAATLELANWGMAWKGAMPTTEVGSYPPNAYGIYDGIGNVWEWTSSLYRSYDENKGVDLEDGKERRVLRGGDWFVQPEDVNVYTRFALEPQVRGLMDGGVGFRCVMGT